MKVQLLTLPPNSWSIWVTAQTFGVSERMVKTVRKIKRGICAPPDAKVGKPLPKEIADRVQRFYEDDDL